MHTNNEDEFRNLIPSERKGARDTSGLKTRPGVWVSSACWNNPIPSDVSLFFKGE
ncbi:MAG: hypothetical protein V4689_08265 [Verrucomicrobiota bacterium]